MSMLDSRRLLEVTEIMESAKIFGKRQSFSDFPDGQVDGQVDDSNDWWFSSTAYVVRWAIVSGIFLVCLAWFVGGYLHAKKRIRKGLPLLAYHRWMVPGSRQPGYRPTHPTYMPYHRPQQQYQEPPPLYEANGVPPVYVPPQKVPPVAMEEGLATQTAPLPPQENLAVIPPRPTSRQ